MAGGAWVFRTALAELAIENALQSQGVDASVSVAALSLSNVRLESLRLGPVANPDLAARDITGSFGWRGLSPSLDQVEIGSLSLRAAWIDQKLSFGQLDRLVPEQTGATTSPPPIRLRLGQAKLLLATPWGALEGDIAGDGRLTQDWVGGGAVRLVGESGQVGGPLALRYDETGVTGALEAQGERFTIAGVDAQGLDLSAELRASPDLQQLAAKLRLAAQEAAFAGVLLRAPAVEGGLEARGAAWSGEVAASAGGAAGAEWGAGRLEGALSLSGEAQSARGQLSAQAADLAAGDWRLASLRLGGPVQAEAEALRADLAIQAAEVRATDSARARWTAPLREASGSPLAPLLRQAGAALTGAMRGAEATAAVEVKAEAGAVSLRLREPARLLARSGQSVTFTPAGEGVAITGAGLLEGSGVLAVAGPGLPLLHAELQDLRRGPDGAGAVQGALELSWRSPEAALQLGRSTVSAQWDAAGRGGVRVLDGRLRFSGGEAAAAVQEFEAPLSFMLAWGEAQQLALTEGGCLPIRWRSAQLGGLALGPLEARLCQSGGALFARDQAGAVSGGGAVAPFSLAGTMDGRTINIGFGGLEGRWRAGQLALSTPGLQIAGDGGLAARTGAVSASVRLEPVLAAQGRLAGFEASLPEAPSQLAGGGFAWRWSPAAGLAISDGVARITAQEPAAGEIALHEPLALREVQLQLRNGEVEAAGALFLEEPQTQLGRFELRHALGPGRGELRFDTGELVFSPALQPTQITRQLLGVVDLARGGLSLQGQAAWDGARLTSGGSAVVKDLSFATLSLGPITGVDGVVTFDDLLALTTPPGQTLRVGEINPGLKVSDGLLAFQIMPDLMLQLESARWPYAGGQLSVDPTVIELGGEVTRMQLRLTDVDLSALLQELALNETLRATGAVTGEFPLVFTPSGGRIENGRLRALGGGLIAMQSQSLDQTVAATSTQAAGSGASFLQALQGFRYDELALVSLNGDLDGELTADIRFSGENIAPVDLPTLGGKGLVGLPYRFNVRISAPIRGLAETVQGALDVREGIRAAVRAAEEERAANPP